MRSGRSDGTEILEGSAAIRVSSRETRSGVAPPRTSRSVKSCILARCSRPVPGHAWLLWNDAGTRSSITPVTCPCWSTARLVHRDACDPGVRLVCALTIPLWVDVVAGRVRLERREALPPPGQGAVSDLCAGLDRLRRLTVTQRPSLNDGEPSMPSRNGEGSRLTPKLCYTIMSE